MSKILCGECGEHIPEDEFKAHWVARHRARAHPNGPDQARRSRLKSRVNGFQDLSEWKTCATCGASVKRKNFSKHVKRHQKSGTTTENPKKTRVLPEYREPIDFLDRPNVVSGGGFGVGKGKKR